MLLVLGLGVVVGLLVGGAARPRLGVVLVLAAPLALCVNRFVFFPNEVGFTADAAIVFAAIVGLSNEAIWLGPVVVALLVGPLDARHWETRSFVRMAYNSGSSALVTAVGIVAFLLVNDAVGSSTAALLVAAAIAAVPYVMMESILGVTLVVLHHEPIRTAWRHQLPVNAVAIPLGVAGAAAGVVALNVGWWLAALALLPMAYVPELVLVTARRGLTRPQTFVVSAMALLVVGAIAGARFAPAPDVPIGLTLLACAVVVGADLRVGGRAPIPWMAALVVTLAVIVTDGGPRIGGAVFAAAVTTAVAWSTSGHTATEWPRATCAVTTAGIAAGAGAVAVVSVVVDGQRSSATAGAVAGLAFASIVITAGPDRLDASRRALWAVPLLGVAAALGMVWRALGSADSRTGLVVLVGTAVAVAAVATSGTPPWPSRRLSRWAASAGRSVAVGAVVVAAGVACAGAVAAVLFEHRSRSVAVFAALAAGVACADAMALVAVRQWRFSPGPAPGRRRCSCWARSCSSRRTRRWRATGMSRASCSSGPSSPPRS